MTRSFSVVTLTQGQSKITQLRKNKKKKINFKKYEHVLCLTTECRTLTDLCSFSAHCTYSFSPLMPLMSCTFPSIRPTPFNSNWHILLNIVASHCAKCFQPTHYSSMSSTSPSVTIKFHHLFLWHDSLFGSDVVKHVICKKNKKKNQTFLVLHKVLLQCGCLVLITLSQNPPQAQKHCKLV